MFDIVEENLDKCDFIVCYYTLQFIPPSVRQTVVNKLYESLNWGGGLLVFEKVRAADARFQDMMTTLYNDYKLRAGYSAEEIITKPAVLKEFLNHFPLLLTWTFLRDLAFLILLLYKNIFVSKVFLL